MNPDNTTTGQRLAVESEWTAEQCQAIQRMDGWQSLATAINAALVAERANTDAVRKFWQDAYDIVKATLDSERAKAERLAEALRDMIDDPHSGDFKDAKSVLAEYEKENK